MEKDFDKLINTFQESIFTWGYFTDFEKVNKNISKIERKLNLLNSLIGKDNIENEFIDLIKEYPEVKEVLPILIAVRKDKLKELSIISDIINLDHDKKYDIFYEGLNEENAKELKIFFNESGLKDIFKNKNIKNVVDYVFGIEVGMDTNARKNRTGDLMEDLVEKFLEIFCKDKNFVFIEQATKVKIKKAFNYDLEIDKNNRRFDFALFNKEEKKLYLMEVNYYGGGGSKLKATAGEYQKLNDFLKNQNITFIWVTDGKGWLTSRNSLKETFKHNDYVINLEMLKNGSLKTIVK
ncbi:MAG: type II restriction endonuclease [Patescibacteria group bacterium]|jgi:type II restriction enzyme